MFGGRGGTMIRPEAREDHDAVRRVIVDAFAHSEFGYHGEADIVDRVRDECAEVLSLVATDAERIVGHILFSPVAIHTADKVVRGMGLAPMAVSPDHQQMGIGTALVETGLRQLDHAGCPFVVVLGHPAYYPRFGFLPAARYGISHRFVGIPQDVFFVRGLKSDVLETIRDGTASYRHEFGAQPPIV